MALKDYFDLLRPFNCLMAAIATYIGFAIASNGFGFSNQAAYAMLSVFLICGAGQAINDYFDRAIDRKLKPKKPIPSGRVEAGSVLIYSLALFLLGIFVSFQINSTSFAIAVAASLALIAYSGFMKKLKFFGNFIVAIGTGATLIYGAASAGNIFSTFYLAALAILANYGRELTKDIEDIKGDSGKKFSLPMVFGIGKTKIVAYAAYFAAVYLSYFIYFDKIFGNLFYLAIITISNFMLLKALLLLKKNNFSASQKFSKYAMAAALVSFVAGLVKSR